LLSLAVHAALFADLLQWQPTPPRLGSPATALTVALVSAVNAPAAAEPQKDTEHTEEPLQVDREPPPPEVKTSLEEDVVHAVEAPRPIPEQQSLSRPETQIARAETPVSEIAPVKRPEVKQHIIKPKPKTPPAIAKTPVEPPKPDADEAVIEPPAIEPKSAEESSSSQATSKPDIQQEPSTEPAVILDPSFRHPPAPPPYPRRARRLGQEGTVIVQARLDGLGDVRETRIITSSGHRLLDEAALKAVRGWEFAPASRQGRGIDAWVQMPVQFVLN
jgi:protein TonB